VKDKHDVGMTTDTIWNFVREKIRP